MQPIERIGVFALLFLVVTVVAVWLWDPEPTGPVTDVAAKERRAAVPERTERATPKVPQLGQTTRPKESERRTLEPAAKPKPEAKAAAETSKPTSSRLPVSDPKRELTPAPKPSVTPRRPDARSEPANRPSPSSRAQKDAVVLEPKPSVSSANSAVSQPEPKSSTPKAASRKVPATYTVKAGDTLSEISLEQLGTSKRWKEIAALNGVDASGLVVGMELRLPGGEVVAKSDAPAGKAAAKAPKAGASYRVAEGDSLWLIAKYQLGDGNRWAEIAKLNPELNPDKLVVGMTLVLPEGAAPKRTLVADNTTSAPKKSSSRPRVR